MHCILALQHNKVAWVPKPVAMNEPECKLFHIWETHTKGGLVVGNRKGYVEGQWTRQDSIALALQSTNPHCQPSKRR